MIQTASRIQRLPVLWMSNQLHLRNNWSISFKWNPWFYSKITQEILDEFCYRPSFRERRLNFKFGELRIDAGLALKKSMSWDRGTWEARCEVFNKSMFCKVCFDEVEEVFFDTENFFSINLAVQCSNDCSHILFFRFFSWAVLVFRCCWSVWWCIRLTIQAPNYDTNSTKPLCKDIHQQPHPGTLYHSTDSAQKNYKATFQRISNFVGTHPRHATEKKSMPRPSSFYPSFQNGEYAFVQTPILASLTCRSWLTLDLDGAHLCSNSPIYTEISTGLCWSMIICKQQWFLFPGSASHSNYAVDANIFKLYSHFCLERRSTGRFLGGLKIHAWFRKA
jgi:hypothetical protein